MLSNVNGQTGLACTGRKDINGFVDLLRIDRHSMNNDVAYTSV